MHKRWITALTFLGLTGAAERVKPVQHGGTNSFEQPFRNTSPV